MLASRSYASLCLLPAIVLLGVGSAVTCRAEEKAAKKAPTTDKREDVRFDGKSFDYWRTYLHAELKPERRIEAVEAMKAFAGNGYSKEAARAMIDMMKTYKGELTEKDREVWTKALCAFREIVQASESMLVGALADPHPHLRSFAVSVLACHAKTISREALPGLVRAVVDGQDDKWLAVPALVKIDGFESLLGKELRDQKRIKKFVKAMTDIIEKESEAGLALLFASDSDKKELAKAISSSPAFAAALLGEMGPAAKGAVPCLLKCMNTEHFSINAASLASTYALGKIGAEPEEVIPALIGAVKKHNYLSFHAACALARFGVRAKSAAPALRQALANKDLSVSLGAFVALGNIGEDARKSVPAVIGTLRKSDRGTRLELYRNLQEKQDLPFHGIVPVLIGAFEQFPAERPEIASALGYFGPKAREAVGCLTKAVDDKNPRLQRAAADALRKIKMEK